GVVERTPEDALRAGDVVGREEHGRIAVGGIGKPVKGKVTGAQRVVRPARGARRSRIEPARARIELVLDPAVGAGVEVAAPAGPRLRAARVHVPAETHA